MMGNGYTKDAVQKMEDSIMKVLGFNVHCTSSSLQCLEVFKGSGRHGGQLFHLAHYLIELALVEYTMLSYPPSQVAAAAVLLSNKLLKGEPWCTPGAAQQVHKTEQLHKKCAKDMCTLLEKAPTYVLKAVLHKFSQSKYQSVAKLTFGPIGSMARLIGSMREGTLVHKHKRERNMKQRVINKAIDKNSQMKSKSDHPAPKEFIQRMLSLCAR